MVRQLLEDAVGESAGQPQLVKFALEERFFVGSARDLPRFGEKTRRRIDGDILIRIDDPGAKGDGGNVALSRGTQTHDEAQRSFGQPGLIRMRYNRGIEKRRRFERILVDEVS